MDDRKGGLEATLVPLFERTAPVDGVGGITAAAFGDLVREHQRRIYRILLLLLRDVDTAETLTQECFLRAFSSRSRFRGEASVGTWLVRIALNLARDHAKSRRLAFWRLLMREGRAVEPIDLANRVPDPKPHPERTLLARERLAAVWATVQRLPRRQRTCFLLRFVEEMPLEQIAQAMQLEVGTVKSHLARAVGALRRQLTETEEDGPCKNI